MGEAIATAMMASTAAHAAKRPPIGRAPAWRGPLACTAHGRAQGLISTFEALDGFGRFFFLFKKRLDGKISVPFTPNTQIICNFLAIFPICLHVQACRAGADAAAVDAPDDTATGRLGPARMRMSRSGMQLRLSGLGGAKADTCSMSLARYPRDPCT